MGTGRLSGKAAYEIGLRHLRRGWEWQIVTFERGHMLVRAKGTAPFRWMARIDAARCLRRNRAVLVPDYSWLDGIDLR
jgi:hypothetical protein